MRIRLDWFLGSDEHQNDEFLERIWQKLIAGSNLQCLQLHIRTYSYTMYMQMYVYLENRPCKVFQLLPQTGWKSSQHESSNSYTHTCVLDMRKEGCMMVEICYATNTLPRYYYLYEQKSASLDWLLIRILVFVLIWCRNIKCVVVVAV